GCSQSEAVRRQGKIRGKRDSLLDYGSGRSSRYYGVQYKTALAETQAGKPVLHAKDNVMKKKSDKEKDLEALRKEFEAAQSIFLTGYEKLTVQQDFELRKTVRGAGGNYRVIKNNLAEKASQGTPAE